MHTDQGRNFESDLFQAFCKVLEITKTRTTPYHASGNGQVEVFNRVILQMIRSYVSRGKKDWDEHLPLISMALHSMKNKSTGFSANMMMLGRDVCQPIDLILGLTRSTPRDPLTWVAKLLSNLSDIHKLARERIGEAQLRQKRDYDLRLFERSYKLGDVVYLVDSSNEIGVSRKLRPPWTGPFLIVEINPRSKSGSAYILVMVDQFTKWVELAALPAQNAELTARAFLRHFIVTFGFPFEVHTDQGRNFESDLFQAFCKVLEITKTRTTPYHASGNGQVEVFNRVILQMIRSYVSRGKKDWDEHLPLISMALHSMKNKSTGFSANMMMLGRDVCQPIDLILGLTRSTPRDPPTWVAKLLSNLSDIHKLARERIGEA